MLVFGVEWKPLVHLNGNFPVPATFTTDCPVPSDAPGRVDSVVLAKRNSRHSCVTSPETQGVVEKGWNPCEFSMIFLSRFGDWFGLMFRLVVFGHHPSLSKMIEIASTLIIPLFLNAAASNGSKVGTCHTCFGTRKIDWAVNRCQHPLKRVLWSKGNKHMSKCLVPALCNVMYIKSYTRFHLRYLSFLELNNMICESSWLCKCQNNSLSSLWGMFDTNSFWARSKGFLSGSKFVWNVGIECVSIVWEKGNWQFPRVVERMSQTKGYTVMSVYHMSHMYYINI